MYQYHISVVDTINARYNIRAYAVIGPHPAELTEMLKRGISLNSAMKLMIKAIDLAIDIILSDRRKCIALGEVGRPHYKVPSVVWKVSNDILSYALERAAETNLPVQIHMETPNEENLHELSEIIDKAGIKRNKVIIHHAPPIVRLINSFGFIPSVVARENYIKAAIREGGYFLLETDYLDDPRRPGAVLSLRTIPKNVRRLLRLGILNEVSLEEIFVRLPEKVYCVPFR